MIKNNMRIVFQGDSITDCGRNREPNCSFSESLGSGYAAMTAHCLNALYPCEKLQAFNRGVGGNRVDDLAIRWKDDCLALKPDVVTLLIGINDAWRTLDSGYDCNAEAFESMLESILSKTKSAGAKIILIEPFAIDAGSVTKEWLPHLNKIIETERKLARAFADDYIPMHAEFARAMLNTAPQDIACDGVHPTNLGHRMIARRLTDAIINLK